MFHEVVNELVKCVEEDKMIHTFGCGGNAANAIHFAAELSGKFEEYEDPLPCICLSENVATITAITNDFSWETCFSRQVTALTKKDDVLVILSISSSGVYLNPAIKAAKDKGCKIVLIHGYGKKLDVDVSWRIGDDFKIEDTAIVQEMQLKIIHDICREVKKRLSLNGEYNT